MGKANHTWSFASGPDDACDVDESNYHKLLGARLVGMGKDPHHNFETLILYHPELGYVCIKAEAYLAYGDPTGEFGIYHARVNPEDGRGSDLEFLDTSIEKEVTHERQQ